MENPNQYLLNSVVIPILCMYISDMDLFNLSKAIDYIRVMITTSELICKIILLRDYNYLDNSNESKSQCHVHLVCNKNMSSLITPYWVKHVLNGDMKLMHTLQLKTYQQYTIYKRIWFQLFYKTTTFKMMSRIMSFKYWSNQQLLNLFEHDVCKYRMLSTFEQVIFTPVHIYLDGTNIHIAKNSQNKLHLEIANNMSKFTQTFEARYRFSTWSNYINWQYFIISGSSVLSCILNKDWTSQSHHDVDIYSHDIDINVFKTHVINVYRQCGANATNYINKTKIMSFKLTFGTYTMTLQFIFTCQSMNMNQIIENFDLDICQVLYDVRTNKIMCTMAFLQCLQTCYIIPYQLIIHDNIDNWKHIGRIKKYINRGFNQLLIPVKIPIKKLQDQLQVTFINDQRSDEQGYYKSIIPCDYYNVQEHFFAEIQRTL